MEHGYILLSDDINSNKNRLITLPQSGSLCLSFKADLISP